MIYIYILRDKVIYCPCDEEGSNYVKYLKENKDRLCYKELIYTSLKEGYDFATEKARVLFEKADVIITNPPFSKIGLFIDTCLLYNCDFLLLAPSTVFTRDNIFNLLKQERLRMGFTCRGGGKHFITPNHINDDKEIACRYITTLDIPTYKDLVFSREYEEGYYDYIDNTDIINVNKTKDIPSDYFKPMAVPVSFISNYNPEQFEILDLLKQPIVNGKYVFKRFLIKRKR